jgi:ferritin
VYKKVKEHERRVSEAIDGIADLAVAEKDHATRALLDWFVTEQVEEQAVSSNIHARLKLIAGDPSGLLALDRELGARTYVVPAPLAGKL